MTARVIAGLCAGLLLVPAVPALAAELEIFNNSRTAILHLQVALVGTGKGKWGPDRLADQGGPIAPGARHVVRDLRPGDYDLRLSDAQDRDCEIYRRPIEGTTRLELTDAMLEDCGQESH
jgi:hypothetical protein